LETTGPHSERLVAFARSAGDAVLLVVVPRLIASLLRDAETPLPPAAAWDDTRVTLPEFQGARLHDLLIGAMVDASPDGLLASEVLATLPVALLTTERPAA
jgi:(1->4)-alpha-D-glucan 1-alpha-D-glucosylmutase